jgi:hypothetical protein
MIGSRRQPIDGTLVTLPAGSDEIEGSDSTGFQRQVRIDDTREPRRTYSLVR